LLFGSHKNAPSVVDRSVDGKRRAR
jgi:hypothetical protein